MVSDGSWWDCSEAASPASPVIDSNTVLLLHMDGDASSSQHWYRNLYNTKLDGTIKMFGSGSLYMDGVNRFIELEDSTDWSFGADPFTVDMWARLTDTQSYAGLFNMRTSDGNNFGFYINGNQIAISYRTGYGGYQVFSYAHGMDLNEWYHLALVRIDTNNWGIFVDGILVGSPTLSASLPDYSGSDPESIGKCEMDCGAMLEGYFKGYIDEFRISKGVARWTSDFTAPTSQHLSDSNTKLLLHFDGDESDSAHSISVLSTDSVYFFETEGKFDGGMFFDGDGDYLSIPSSPDFDFGTGDFTIDFWYKDEGSHEESEMITMSPAFDSQLADVSIKIRRDVDSRVQFSTASEAGLSYITPLVDHLYDGGWHHVAGIREDGILKMYVDGNLEASGSSTEYVSANNIFIGVGNHPESHVPTTRYMRGYMDELRISKGIARWTENFTLPTTAYDSN